MKNLLIFLAGYAGAWLVVLAATFFVTWSFDPSQWETFDRFMMLFVGNMVALPVGCICWDKWAN